MDIADDMLTRKYMAVVARAGGFADVQELLAFIDDNRDVLGLGVVRRPEGIDAPGVSEPGEPAPESGRPVLGPGQAGRRVLSDLAGSRLASVPEGSMMRIWHVSDVMTAEVVTVGPATPYREVVALLAAYRINAVPVVDADRRVLGVVSESDLLRKIEYAGSDRPQWFEIRGRAARRKAGALTAGELMTAPAEVVLATTGIRTAARRMDEAHVKQLPVEDLLGRVIGIVSRSDLLKEHLRHDDDILADVRAAIHEALLTERDGDVGAIVDHGQVTLTGRVERWSTAVLAERLVRLVAGVVFVDSRIAFDVDDHDLADPAPAYFVA